MQIIEIYQLYFPPQFVFYNNLSLRGGVLKCNTSSSPTTHPPLSSCKASELHLNHVLHQLSHIHQLTPSLPAKSKVKVQTWVDGLEASEFVSVGARFGTTIVSKEKNANQTRLTLSDSTLESEVIDKDALDPPPQTSKKEEVDIKVQTSFMENLSAPVCSSSSVSSQNTASTLSPRVQTMGRAAGFDSNRLPNTIFSSKASTPMEWCLASNDSLFSLYVGNTSFSKDQFILFRSGELNKYDEILNIQATFPPVSEPNGVENIKIETQEPAVATPETKKTNFYESPGQDTKEHMFTPTDVTRSPTSLSHRSDESYNSTCSFQFPVLPYEIGKYGSPKVVSKRHQTDKYQQLQFQHQEGPQT